MAAAIVSADAIAQEITAVKEQLIPTGKLRVGVVCRPSALVGQNELIA